MNSLDKKSVLIIAAEESSTLYARRILENWKKREIDIHAFGVGNEEMAKIGFERIADSKDMAVVGLSEIWKHWEKIKTTYKKIVLLSQTKKPAFALLLDYPGFNLRIAKDLKKMGIPVVYYISPQLWAWKRGRIKKVKKFVDRMLVLFPFEKKFYDEHEYSADYVGHPLLDEIDNKLLDKNLQQQERQRFGILKDEHLLGLMPGSRLSEIALNLPTQLETIKILNSRHPQLKFALLLAPNLKKEDLSLSNLEISLQIIQKEPFEMIGLCDAILCASGTATLMVGLIEKPMTIMYRMNPFSAWLARRLIQIKYFGLVNIIADEEIMPERFQNEASPEELARLLEKQIFDSTERTTSVQKLREMKTLLGGGGATTRVMSILDEYL